MKNIILILALFIAGSAFSQDNIPAVKNNNFLGINIGATSGVGLTYRRVTGSFATQITFLPYRRQSSKDYIYNWDSFGVMELVKLKESKNIDMNFYFGVHYFHIDRLVWDYLSSYSYSTKKVNEDHFNFGAGINFSFKITDYFQIETGLGYGAYTYGELQLLPTGELSILYGF
jgi:hypothetical protein